MSLVCFDSDVMVWGILRKEQPGFEDMVARVPKFLKELDDSGNVILLPSVVVAELLFAIPIDRQEAFLSGLSRRFVIVPFDVAAAKVFASLWQERKTDGTLTSIQSAVPPRTRAELKADAMIVATALARGADRIYSHDKWLKKVAGSRIPVNEIPRILGQTDLFPERALKLVGLSKPKDR